MNAHWTSARRQIREDRVVNAGDRKALTIVTLFRLTAALSSAQSPALRLLSVPVRVVYRFVVDWVLGVEIPWYTTVGSGFRIHHGSGIVVHGSVVLGNRVSIHQHVTIGSRDGSDRVPAIGDDVRVGASALILGPVRIGDGAIVGAGSVVLNDVPPGGVVVGNPARLIRVAQGASGAS